MYYQPTLISWNDHHFLVMSAPDDTTMKRVIKVSILILKEGSNNMIYIKDLKQHNVKHVARCCDKTYNEKELIDEGIEVHEYKFEDGKLPEEEKIKAWLELVDNFFDS